MRDWQDKFCVLCVNYNTPDLVEVMVGSIREFWPKLKIVLVDGSDDKEKAEAVAKFCARDPNIELHALGYNIHHGPGIVYAMERIKDPYVFLIDTDDVIVRKDIFEREFELMDEGVYAVGSQVLVNGDGMPGAQDRYIPYVFPSGMLLNRRLFYEYPMPVIHDGPFFPTMLAIHEAEESIERLRHFPGLDPIYMKRGAGTTRIRYAEREKCNAAWLLNKQDLTDGGPADLFQRRICHMSPNGSDVAYGIDMLEAVKRDPIRIMRTLAVTQYGANDSAVGTIHFSNFDVQKLAEFFSIVLKAVTQDMTATDQELGATAKVVAA